MSSTIPLPPREQLYNRYCSNKHTFSAPDTLFQQAHRETEAHFTAAGMSSHRNQSDSFRFKRAAFYQSLKCKER